MSELRISRSLSLPAESVTKTFAILAQRRKGKTYTASVMAEEMVKAGIPWVALDPTGAWWGLRAGADGREKGGLRVYVFGGDHGDLPLERTAGKQIADLVVEHPGHYVLDFSHFESKEAERELATAFAERFYRRKGRDKAPMHLFVDEADMFVPQRSPRGDQRMLGAFESLVRRGGIRGIGTTLISQRAAVVNKNVLEQIDVLIALRTVGPNDRKALEGYIEAHGSTEEKRDLMGSIASLDLGEAWVWEPGADLFERVTIRKRRTFNSSATPDGKAAEPVGLKDVDLDALRGKLDHAVEQAKANDPTELKKRLRAAERELKQRPAETKEVEVEKVVEVPVLANGVVDRLDAAVAAIREASGQLGEAADGIATELRRVGQTQNVAQRQVRAKPSPPLRERRRQPAGDVGEALAGQVGGGEELSKQAHAMLGVLVARHPLKLTRSQWSTISGYSQRSSSWSGSITELRNAGLIEEHGREVAPTDAAFDVIGEAPATPDSPEEIVAMWRRSLKGPQAVAFFDALVAIYPDALTRDEISEQTEYSKGSSSFSGTISLLKRNKLIVERPDGLAASEELFEVVPA